MWTEADLRRAPPVSDFPPRWASAWGDDPHGLWADLSVEGVVQRMRWIEPGEFDMGSTPEERRLIDNKDLREWADKNEEPRHQVSLSRGCWLADTPCTQALWMAVMGGENPSEFKDGSDAPQRPVEQVSRDDVQNFLKRLQASLPAGCHAALPLEAEWEYAARAGTTTAYPWGDTPDFERANMERKVNATTPVKRYPANAWGLYDMHGNVWEWCADGLREYQDRPEVDPSGGDEGDTRVLRGGSWDDRAGGARSACRNHAPRGSRWHVLGFRLALRSPGPAGGAGAGTAG